MGFFRTITEKPWESPSAELGAAVKRRPAEILGLRFFMLVVSLLFLLLTSVYVMRMSFPDWQPLPMPWLLWVNTGLLVLASLALEAARRKAKGGDFAATAKQLATGGALGIAFLVGQGLAWLDLIQQGYFAAANPANAFFYMITALHWVHLAGGVVAWIRSVRRVRASEVTADGLRLSVHLNAMYWHFLLVVWLVMFALMLAT